MNELQTLWEEDNKSKEQEERIRSSLLQEEKEGVETERDPVLTEKWRPKKPEDFIDNRVGLLKLKQCVGERRPALVYGPPGVGKTSAVYVVAGNLGLRVVELNASDERRRQDMKDLLRRVQLTSFRPVLYLFDEVDGVKEGQESLIRIIKNSKHPIVLTANELWRLPSELVELCERIKFHPPSLQNVVGRLKEIAIKEGIDVKYDQTISDFRASILAATTGGCSYSSHDKFEQTEQVMRGDLSKVAMNNYELAIWVMDNIPNFFWGRGLFEAYEILSWFEQSGRRELLSCLQSKRGKVTYPRYLRRMKVMK